MIVYGLRVNAPPELIEHFYKKEYGLSTKQFIEEPVDRVMTFLAIKAAEAKRQKIEEKKAHGAN